MFRLLRSLIAIALWVLAVVLVVMGYNPLEAALYGTIAVFVHPSTLAFLLKMARNLAGVERDLSVAARDGNLSLAGSLIAQGANVNVSAAGYPLIVAIIAGQSEVAKLLIESGTDVNLRDREGRTPLLAAAFKNRLEIAELLIERGTDVNAKEHRGGTPLHMAAHNGHAQFVELLLRHGAHADPKDNTGNTPLYVAAFEGYPEIVRILLNAHADVNAKDKYGRSPLLAAVFKNNLQIATMLLDAGADISAMDSEGKSVLQRAHEFPSKPEIITLLQSRR